MNDSVRAAISGSREPDPSFTGSGPTGFDPGRKWTPGPWGTHCSHIYAPDGAIIAVVHNPGSKADDYPLVANRDLMAAAPELYEAVEAMIRWDDAEKAARPFDEDGGRAFYARMDLCAEAFAKAHAAIAKATETPNGN